MRTTALLAAGVVLVLTTTAMLFVPAASPRRLGHAVRREHPGAPPTGLPVFVAQGGADTLVVPTATEGYIASACQGRGRTTFRPYPKDTHGTIANRAPPDVLGFLAGGLAGTPLVSTC